MAVPTGYRHVGMPAHARWLRHFDKLPASNADYRQLSDSRLWQSWESAEGVAVQRMRDAMQHLTVTAHSPDRTVALTVSGAPADIQVKLEPGYERHTDASLAQQVERAVRVAMTAYRQGATHAWEQAAGMTWAEAQEEPR